MLSRAVVSDHFANSSENIMRNRNSTPKTRKKGTKNGGFAAHFACGLFEFWGVEFRFLIIFSEEIAKLSLITARDNSAAKHNPQSPGNEFRKLHLLLITRVPAVVEVV